MDFALHQYESATAIQMYPPSWTPLPTSLPTVSLQIVTEHQFWVPCIINQTFTGYLFIYDNVYVSMLSSQIIPPSTFTESKSLFFMSVSPLLPCT